ncbi:MAG: GHKL domain-containing protein [Oscillospiraceae bacterium]|nr:GHKL domain-containing protein [Oscillospiraceae bacterium]
MSFLFATILTVVLFFKYDEPITIRKKIGKFVLILLVYTGISLLLIIPFATLYRRFFGGWFTNKITCFTITAIMTAALVLLYDRSNRKSNIAAASVFVFFNTSAFFVSNNLFNKLFISANPNVEPESLFHIIDVFSIIGYLACLIPLLFFLRRFSLKKTGNVPLVCWLSSLVTSIPGIVIYLILYRYYGFEASENPRLVLFVLAPQISALAIYYLSYLIASSYEKELEHNVMSVKANENFESMQKRSQLNDDIRELKHDLKNHISLMRTLLAQGDYNNLNSYFDELLGTRFNVVNAVDSGNMVINNVLNNAIYDMEQAGVKFDTHVSIRRNLNISDTDLCSLLSNLLSNAFEATLQTKDPQISVIIREENDFLFISVKNSINESVLFKNPDLVTSKKDKSIHGIGIKSIRSIAKKYNGSVSFTEEDNMFNSNVMLVLKKTPARIRSGRSS